MGNKVNRRFDEITVDDWSYPLTDWIMEGILVKKLILRQYVR